MRVIGPRAVFGKLGLLVFLTFLIVRFLGIFCNAFLEAFTLFMDTAHDIKSVTTRLPPEVYEEFAVAARRRGISIKDCFLEAITRWLDKPTPPPVLSADLQRALESFILQPKNEKDALLRDYLVSKLKSEYSA